MENVQRCLISGLWRLLVAFVQTVYLATSNKKSNMMTDPGIGPDLVQILHVQFALGIRLTVRAASAWWAAMQADSVYHVIKSGAKMHAVAGM